MYFKISSYFIKWLMKMKIFSWGANSYGQLCLDVHSEQSINPIEIKSKNYELKNTISIVGGGGHTLFVDKLGKVYGCGWNNHGQLTGTAEKLLSLTEITTIQNYCIVQATCGWDSSYALTQEGFVFVWGSNKHGQLGISSNKAAIVTDPVKLNVEEIVQISAGLRHTALVTREGLVLVSGQGQKGQLGLLSDNSCPEKNTDTFKKVNLKNVKQVECGQKHTIALTTNCEVFVWGDNKYGQLGLDPDAQPCVWAPQQLSLSHLSPVHPNAVLSVGWTHSALLSGGKVINWGRNNYHQLGESRLYSWKPQELSGLSGVQQLVLGSEHNLARLITGQVVSWGWNEHGNCGTGTTENVTTPSSVKLPGTCILIGTGSGHSFAVIE